MAWQRRRSTSTLTSHLRQSKWMNGVTLDRLCEGPVLEYVRLTRLVNRYAQSFFPEISAIYEHSISSSRGTVGFIAASTSISPHT